MKFLHRRVLAVFTTRITIESAPIIDANGYTIFQFEHFRISSKLNPNIEAETHFTKEDVKRIKRKLLKEVVEKITSGILLEFYDDKNKKILMKT